MLAYLHSFQSEWIKRRHSAAAWLTLAGGMFVPLVVLGVRFYHYDLLASQNARADLWEQLYNRSWQYMGFFLLPLGVILVTSLITQLETGSNAWKLLHVTPQRYITIFLAKLTVILVMLLLFFLLFNIGIYLTAILPAVLIREVPFPVVPFPWLKYLYGSWTFLLACLPIVGIQFMLGLLYRNFMVPLGIGVGGYILAVIAFKWKYDYIIPYIYCMLVFNNNFQPSTLPVNVYVLSVGYFVLFGVGAYALYASKREKG